MRHNMIFFFIIMTAVLVLIDLYVFKAVRLAASGLQKELYRQLIFWGYWSITAIYLAGFIYVMVSGSTFRDKHDYNFFFALVGFGVLFLIPKLVIMSFHLVEDIIRVFQNVAALWHSPSPDQADGGMDRLTFITKTGLVVAAIPFLSVAYGMIKGRFQFKIHKKKIAIPGLPDAFNGVRIVQLSDLHLGSMEGHGKHMDTVFEKVRAMNPDMLVVTGDWINNFNDEVDEFMPMFRALKAPLGKYSILGNHDYGDYIEWESSADKSKNLEILKDKIKEMDFDLLLNEHRIIEKDGEHLNLVGVENWGSGGFAKYGDLDKALEGIPATAPKILLSHDPSHWDAKVLGKKDIALTLSGHTHGMQFGIERAGIKWSPIQWRYPRWAGLYTVNNQHLYVNRGLGYIGFPGRVGIYPEITELKLVKA